MHKLPSINTVNNEYKISNNYLNKSHVQNISNFDQYLSFKSNKNSIVNFLSRSPMITYYMYNLNFNGNIIPKYHQVQYCEPYTKIGFGQIEADYVNQVCHYTESLTIESVPDIYDIKTHDLGMFSVSNSCAQTLKIPNAEETIISNVVVNDLIFESKNEKVPTSYEFHNCTVSNSISGLHDGIYFSDLRYGFANSGFEDAHLMNISNCDMYHAFYNCVNLKYPPTLSGKIPYPHSAFNNCTNLTYFDMKSFDLNSDAVGMFQNCIKLNRVTSDIGYIKPNNADSLFSGCVNLKQVPKIMRDSMYNAYRMFNCCENLSSIDIECDHILYASHMFYGCTNLEYMNGYINNVSNGYCMFMGCENLKVVNIDNIKNGELAFHSCNNISSINLKNISDPIECFQFCNNLTDVNIENISGLSKHMFRYSNIANVTIGNITGNSTNMFYWCNTLKNVNIKNITTESSVGMFSNCTNISNININIDTNNFDIGFYGCTNLVHANIRGNINSCKTLFHNCTNLRDVSIENIGTGYNMFNSCPNITNVYINSIDNATNLLTNSKSVENVTIGETKFASGTFSSCINLKNANIKVTGDDIRYMFNSCTNITNISIDAPYTNMIYDARYTFNTCKKLESVKFSKPITVSNAVNMFINCSNLKSIENISSYGNSASAFESCSSIEYIDKFNITHHCLYRTFFNCKKLKTIEINSTNSQLNLSTTFSGCTNISDINIPNLETISNGYWTFKDCYNLSNLNIGTPNINSGANTFRNCRTLRDINIGFINKDMNHMFIDCRNLVNLRVGDINISSAVESFKNCTNLTNIEFGNIINISPELGIVDSLKTANIGNINSGNNMFSGCVNLESVTIGDINNSNNMFYYCKNLANVNIYGMVNSFMNTFDDASPSFNVRLYNNSIPNTVFYNDDYTNHCFQSQESVTIYCHNNTTTDNSLKEVFVNTSGITIKYFE